MVPVPRTLVVADRRPSSLSGSESVNSDDSGGTRDSEPPAKVAIASQRRPQSPTRLKRSHHKVRTGCITCRQRRVKCDETHPRCLRCAKAGRICEGYTQSRTWLFESSAGASYSDVSLSCNAFHPNPIHFFQDDVDVNRPAQHFVEITAPRIAYYFAEMMDSFLDDKALVKHSSEQAWTFWNRLVIQASETQGCIRHSLAALSSLHEWIELTKRTPWQNNTFTWNYTRAITEINSNHSDLPIEIVLISCILFAHCEYLMGASAAGLTHIKSGYRIISEHRTEQLPISQEISNVIEPIMEGFIAKAENYMLKEETGPGDSSVETTYVSPEMIQSFQGLSHANKYLEHALYWVILLELGQPHYLLQKTHVVRKYVNDWATAFGRWKASLETDDSLLKDWQLLLLSHHRMALLLLRTLPPENDKNYGRAASDFRIMFAQLRTFLRSGHVGTEGSAGNDILLKVHLGYIAPLFFIATQCRVRDIRRNALEALNDLKVVEGHWNSCVAYTIAKALVDIEEQYAETSPTRSIRIKIESVERKDDGSLLMSYHKIPGRGAPDDVGSERITEECCHHDVCMQWPVVRVVQLHGFQASVKPRKLNCTCRSP